jgi:membrane-bound inhibitor of C-type lysozyme
MDDYLRAGALTMLLGLGLARCRDQAPTPRESAAKPPAAAIQGPVNPDVRVVRYTCIDGQTIVAGYPDQETAVVTYKDHAYTLKLGRSASGARYTGYGLQWWTKGAHAAIAALKAGEEFASAPGLDCVAAEGPAAAVTPTRISLPSTGSQRP